MSVLVTKKAPEFTAQAVMPNNAIEELSLSSYKGKYVLMFFYPLDFTFVCPSEILAFNRALNEFKKRDCEILGVSVDSQFSHYAWKETPVQKGGIGNIQFPLIADLDKSISEAYDVLLPDGISLRGLFLIDKEGVVRHQLVNDRTLGRNVDEAIRIWHAMQLTEKDGEVCPANWKQGEEAMKPTAAGVAAYLSKNS